MIIKFTFPSNKKDKTQRFIDNFKKSFANLPDEIKNKHQFCIESYIQDFSKDDINAEGIQVYFVEESKDKPRPIKESGLINFFLLRYYSNQVAFSDIDVVVDDDLVMTTDYLNTIVNNCRFMEVRDDVGCLYQSRDKRKDYVGPEYHVWDHRNGKGDSYLETGFGIIFRHIDLLTIFTRTMDDNLHKSLYGAGEDVYLMYQAVYMLKKKLYVTYNCRGKAKIDSLKGKKRSELNRTNPNYMSMINRYTEGTTQYVMRKLFNYCGGHGYNLDQKE